MSDKQVFIFEVSKQSFDSAVILNSHKLPVIVEFMAVWSAPCVEMSEGLSQLARQFSGKFIFAKVDIDEQPELTKQYGVENVPCIKVFQNGEVVRTEERLMDFNELKLLLKDFSIYSLSDEQRLQAKQLHLAGDTVKAIQVLTAAMKSEPSNVKIAMDMVQIFIDLKQIEQAKNLFNQLPEVARSSDTGKQLFTQLSFAEIAAKTLGIDALQQQLNENNHNCDAHFDIAMCYIDGNDYKQAANHLFQILNIDANFKQGAARELILTMSQILEQNNPDLSASFRRQLGNYE